jgi:peptidoglycan/LPS O-acetylase OafA/YrhL
MRATQDHSIARLPGLDAIRAFSVLAVILMHYGVPHINGGYGVVAFFVLSGFLITWLLLQEHSRFGRIDFSAFYARRSLRIFPAFYVYLTVSLVLLLAFHKPVNWKHFASSALYISNYYHATLGDPDDAFSHTWSLAIEEQFYVLWPVALALMLRSKLPVALLLAGAIVIVWIYRWFLVSHLQIDQAWVYAAFDTRCDALLVGCLLAVLIFQERLGGLLTCVTKNSALPLVFIAALCVAVGPYPRLIPRYRDIVGFAVAPPIIAILIVQTIFLSTRRPWSWLQWTWIRYLGRISYGMYLYQQLVADYIHRHVSVSMWIGATLAVAATTLCASISYWALERPLLGLKRNFTPLDRSTVGPAS